jgi:hypothetical protein
MTEKLDLKEFFSAADYKLVIQDIFAIYHHKWDVLGELIQNAVDSVLKRKEEGERDYHPAIDITYNSRIREITINDNGNGITPKEMRKIVAPHVSLKSKNAAFRGEFGVGLTLVAFSSNDFIIESLSDSSKSALIVKNGYSWAMDNTSKETIDIIFNSEKSDDENNYCNVIFKPVRFPEYDCAQLDYIIRRYTAIGDFWSCYKKEEGPIDVSLTYIDEQGEPTRHKIENKFWHPGDYLKLIDVETVDYKIVENEIKKGKEYALPNWVGFGLIDKDLIIKRTKEFTYYALFCRAPYYNKLGEIIGLTKIPDDDELDADYQESGGEFLNSGIFVSKKGMPLGVVVDHPRTAQAGYWRNMFLMLNCDNISTEPGRKKLHVDDEQLVRDVAKEVFYKMMKYSHYIIPRDPDEEFDSLLRDVDKNIEEIKKWKNEHQISNFDGKLSINIEPVNEQTVIALFHELIGAKIILGYHALKLASTDTYDGIYNYEISKEHIGKEAWQDWLRQIPARERKEIEEKNIFSLNFIIIEYKLHLHDIIQDFLKKTKYHPHIKLIVAWDADEVKIRNKGWLLEPLSKQKRKFFGAHWRLRPSSEGQSRGIIATDVILLKDCFTDPN